MRHICRYFLVDNDGVRRCSQCNAPAHSEGIIETKEASLGSQILPPESKRIKVVATSGHKRGKSKRKR